MSKRNKRILSIGFPFIALTCIIVAAFFIRDISNEKIDPIDKNIIIPVYFFFVFPIILEELSFLRSVYKLINFSPRTSAKICYIVSAVIVSAAFLFGVLVFTKVITKHIFPEGPKAASSRLLELLFLIEWSAVITSFALGSAKGRK